MKITDTESAGTKGFHREAWINPWRQEARSLLLKIPVFRNPALRRSLRPDFLFAADLPRCAAPESLLLFLRMMEEAGWEGLEEQGWIQMRKASISLPEDFFDGDPEEESAALASLLRRHPGSGDADTLILLLIKSREEGGDAWRRACRSVHLELARRLRTGEDFPALFPGETAGGQTPSPALHPDSPERSVSPC